MLPYLLAGLSESAVADYRAATYMIIGQLASRATFSADLATGAGACGAVQAGPAQQPSSGPGGAGQTPATRRAAACLVLVAPRRSGALASMSPS